MKVKSKFKIDPNYKIYSATGVWGGLTPNGMVLCDFIIEHQERPEYVEIEIDAQNNIKEIVPDTDYEKLVQCGLILAPNDAMAIGKWLIESATRALGDPMMAHEKQ